MNLALAAMTLCVWIARPDGQTTPSQATDSPAKSLPTVFEVLSQAAPLEDAQALVIALGGKTELADKKALGAAFKRSMLSPPLPADGPEHVVEFEIRHRNRDMISRIIDGLPRSESCPPRLLGLDPENSVERIPIRVARRSSDSEDRVLLMHGLFCNSSFNVQRTTADERAIEMTKSAAIPILRSICARSEGSEFTHVGVCVVYLTFDPAHGGSDFTTKMTSRPERVAVVASTSDLLRLSKGDLSQEDVLDRCDVYLDDRDSDLKKVRLRF